MMNDIIISKACTKCGAVKGVTEFYASKRACKTCTSDAHTTYRKSNLKKASELQAAWKKRNPGVHAARMAAYRKENPEKEAAARLEMLPAYVAARLSIPVAVLTPELLALKREQLSIHRLSRQINKAVKAQGASQ